MMRWRDKDNFRGTSVTGGGHVVEDYHAASRDTTSSQSEDGDRIVEYHDTTVFGGILHPAAAAQQSAQNQDTVGD
jgi:hypothetical protein